MQVQVNTDHHIKGDEALATSVRATVESALRRSSDYITRVEVHLSDENGDKRGQNDKRCVMEARLEGRQPSRSRTRQRPWTRPSTARRPS
jgi:hypothetical protein